MAVAYIGLGSNLADPCRQLLEAFEALADLPHSFVSGRAGFYRTAPVGPQDQPDYINSVACLETVLEPLALLDALQEIEASQGRDREQEQRWGARTLDLDLLLYDQQTIDLPRLLVPHPRMHERAFVLAPLLELVPEIILPGGQSAADLLQACGAQQIEKLND